MPVIAALTKTENGYSGTIRTLTLDAKISIDAVEKTKDTAPDYRVFLGRMEIGAGWKKEGRERPGICFREAGRPELPEGDPCQPVRREGRARALCSGMGP